jgi:hypothetical protein
MYRVNYYAPNFGFVGWEVFTSKDSIYVMEKSIAIACSQMSKQIEEKVSYQIIPI